MAAPDPVTSRVRFGVLGPLEAHVGGTPVGLGGAKQQLVLALLLLEANHVVAAERLVDWVWADEASDRSAGTLQVYMSNLRRILAAATGLDGGEIIRTRRPGYVIELDDDQLDLLEFEALRREGEVSLAAGRPADAATSLRAALVLWRGEPLAGLMDDANSAGVVSRLEVARLTVMELTAEAEMAIGRHREVLDELQSWVAAHPLHEGLRAQLMLALYRSNRQAEALATFREGREVLVEELGIDPSRALRDLEDRILRQDPDLDLGAGRAPSFDDFGDASATVVRGSVLWQPAHLESADGPVPLERPVTTIGRLGDRDIVVADAQASRHHAEIRRSADTWRLVDTGSANGTLLNGERITECDLADGDVIRVGETELRFRLGAP